MSRLAVTFIYILGVVYNIWFTLSIVSARHSFFLFLKNFLNYLNVADTCTYFPFLQTILKIWALQDGTTVVIGGKTNRAKGEFPDEMNYLLDRVPELVDKTQNKPSESMSV